MNKRIKKKHDLNRKHCLINKAESIRFNLDYCFISTLLSNGYYIPYPIYSDIYWIEYDKWFNSIKGKRCLSYILKKQHIPKSDLLDAEIQSIDTVDKSYPIITFNI